MSCGLQRQKMDVRCTAKVAAAAINPEWVRSYGPRRARLAKAERINAKAVTVTKDDIVSEP